MNQLDQMGKEIDDLYKVISMKNWVQFTTGFGLGIKEAQAKAKEYVKDPEKYKIVLRALESDLPPLERRKAQILNREMKNYHLSEKVKKISDDMDELKNSLMNIVNKFRCQIDGKEVSSTERGKIVSESPDRKLRQKAFESRLPLNQLLVDNGFIKLLNLRNELAQACGFENFVDYNLDKCELNSGIFKNWTSICGDRVEKYQAKSRSLAQQHLSLENLMPWDQSYLINQLCPYNDAQVDLTNFLELLVKTFSRFDFDITKLNLTYDIYPRRNKSEWGYHFSIEAGKDSRILANVSNRFSDYNVLLHETAHGVHYMGLNPEEILFNAGSSAIVAEGFANFFGSQSHSRDFISHVFKDNSEQVFLEFQKLKSVEHFQNYRSIAELIFDHELYTKELKSADDLQELRQSVGKQILGEQGSLIPWASKVHHTSHPIYLHNYVLGDVMSENMSVEFSRRFDGKLAEEHPQEFGRFWKRELLDPSGKDPFLALYKKVFDSELSITEYIDRKCLA